MNKPGRNDPCPCGSGKKYKKCHLAEDASAAAATLKAPGMYLGEPLEDFDAEYDDELFGEDGEAEIDEELDELLHEVDFPDMIRLLKAYLPQAEPESAEFARGFFKRVWDAAESLKDRDAYRDLLHRLGRENPEIFAEIGGLLLWDILEHTIADGRQDSLEPLFVGYAVVASRDLSLFLSVADGMAFFGLLETLVKGMRSAWPYVRDSKFLSPGAKEKFARKAINYEVFTAVEASGPLDAADLGVRIRNFKAWEDGEIQKYLELISDNRSEVFRKEELSASPEERRRNPESQAAFQEKLNTLANVFCGFLRREKGVSWPQADMAAAEILEILWGGWEDPFTEEPEEEGAADDKPGIPIRNLCPDPDLLDDYFVEKLYDSDMQEYRACALWSNISYWPEILVRLGLVDQAAIRDIRTLWEPVLKAVANEFEDFPAPPSASRSTSPG